MSAFRKRSTPLLLAITLTLAILFFRSHDTDGPNMQLALLTEAHVEKIAANRTLGFGAVVVVSRDGSSRRHSLVQAANVTDIDLTVPPQPEWTEADVQRFINGQKNVQRGSILAWLGHHNSLRWFLDSGLETALILEDDVDWDIRLRSIQVPLAAGAVRQLLPPASFHPFASLGSSNAQYWGNHNAWDLLYLGHCGDYFDVVDQDGPKGDRQSFDLSAMPHILYRDPTLPLRNDMHPFTQRLFKLLGMPEQSRVLHRSRFPLCSFGYAVTRPAAKRLLRDLAPPRYTENGPRAYDVAVLQACEKGSKRSSPPSKWTGVRPDLMPSLRYRSSGPGLRCWTLNSELFHHMPGRSLVDEIGEMSGEMPGVPPIDLAAQAQVVSRNETTNIDCGFWSGAFAFDEDDLDRLRFLQDQVGRKGNCLKQGRQKLADLPTAHFKDFVVHETSTLV